MTTNTAGMLTCVVCGGYLGHWEEDMSDVAAYLSHTIIANMYYQTCSGHPITFTIGSIEYHAEEGMTWSEWVESEYNTDGFINDSYYISMIPGGGNKVINEPYEALDENTLVNPTDIIINGHIYDTNMDSGEF